MMKVLLTTTILAAAAMAPSSATDPHDFWRTEEVDDGEEGIAHYGFESRIVGGSVANADKYPFHVNIGGCGGSL